MLSYRAANGRRHPAMASCRGSFGSGLPGKKSDNKGLDLQAVLLQLDPLALTFAFRQKLSTSRELSKSTWVSAGVTTALGTSSLVNTTDVTHDVPPMCSHWPPPLRQPRAERTRPGSQVCCIRSSSWRPDNPRGPEAALIHSLWVRTSPLTPGLQTAPVKRANPHGRRMPIAGSESQRSPSYPRSQPACPRRAKCRHAPSCPTAVQRHKQRLANEARNLGGRVDRATPFPARSGATQGSRQRPLRCAVRLCSKDHPRTSAHSFLMGDKSLQRRPHGQILLIF